MDKKDGVLTNGVFSVANDKKVYFSQGNLQYQVSTGLWRFAEHQYDALDDENYEAVEENDCRMDLFGWGTSGWDSGANAYKPNSFSEDSKDYLPGGSGKIKLVGEFANADWGVYNKITNGGNQPGMWRTLTRNEWEYLIFMRDDAERLYSIGCVGEVNGLILLPDDYYLKGSRADYRVKENAERLIALPPCDGLTKLPPSSFTPRAAYFFENEFTPEGWAKMEEKGAVFLPVETLNAEFYGRYWSTSGYDEEYACAMEFEANGGYLSYDESCDCLYCDNVAMTCFKRCEQLFVRLVKDVE